MRLTEIKAAGEFFEYTFKRARSDGELLDTLRIFVDSQNCISKIEIENNIEGNCAFAADGKLLYCEAWETEDEAQQASHWSRHYTKRVGRSLGGVNDALRIFSSLAGSVSDSYLKFLLRHFPAKESKIFFDADIFSPVVSDEALGASATQTEKVPENNPEAGENLEYSARRWRVWVAGITIISVLTVLFFIATRWSAAHERRKLEKSETVRLLTEATLFPVAPLMDRPSAEFMKTPENARPQRFIRPDLARPMRDLAAFLDEIYLLDRAQQILIYHNSVMLNQRFSINFKAESLRRLFNENLVSFVSRESRDIAPFAYEYLKNQVHRDMLFFYLYSLIAEQPASATKTEALLILDRVVTIEFRVIELLFYTPEIKSLCEDDAANAASAEQFAVCMVRQKYQDRFVYDLDALRRREVILRSVILKSAEKADTGSYRSGDIQFAIFEHQLETAKTAEEFDEVYGRFRRLKAKGFQVSARDTLVKFDIALQKLQNSIRNLQEQKQIESELTALRRREQLLQRQQNKVETDLMKVRQALGAASQASVAREYNAHKRRLEKLGRRQ